MRTTTLFVFSIAIAWCALMSSASAQSNQDVRKYTNVKYMVWQIREGNYAKAIELCEERIQSNPDDQEPLFGLAMAYGQIRLHSLDTNLPPITSSSVTTTAEKDYTATISVDGLKPDTRYRYDVLIGGDTVPIQQRPEFRTATLPGTKTRFHVGFGGGANYSPRNERMWDTVRSRAPLAFLFLGDNSYFNIPDVPAHQRYFFYRRHSRPEYRRMIASKVSI